MDYFQVMHIDQPLSDVPQLQWSCDRQLQVKVRTLNGKQTNIQVRTDLR
jgi:hypothetical protein